MTRFGRHVRIAAIALTAALVALPSVAQAGSPPKSPPLSLTWTDCDDGFQCATAKVPLSYAKPWKGTYDVALLRKVATDPSKRIGSLFTNPGGPGGDGTGFVRSTARSLYANLNTRYDIVGFDPRGTGDSQQALDCKANQETEGIYSHPFTTPESDLGAVLRKDAKYVAQCQRLNGSILPYVTTGNVARDLDLLRQAVGDDKLNYLGFSYGTFLGATYASLFPGKLGHVVLDGPVDATTYINDPMADLQAQTAGFEREIGRFLQACAADQVACAGFGGKDPWSAYDRIVEQANETPLQADGNTEDPRPVTGDEINLAVTGLVYAKFLWPYLAQELAAAEKGDGAPFRAEVDGSYGLNLDTGGYDPGNDRYFLIGAIEQNYDQYRLKDYLRAGKVAFDSYDHAFYNTGYVELNYGLFKTRGDGVYGGPFKVPGGANTPLVVATTYDPATPYRGAKALVRDLGNARLLTMDGDNHTAYGGNSPCIDAAVDAYMFDGTLPPAGTRCQQDVPFEQPAPPPEVEAKRIAPTATTPDRINGPHIKPVDLRP